MFPFSQPVNPALRAHLDSQLAFFNDLSQSLSGSFQSVCQANVKLGQTMFEETLSAGQRMLTSTDANGVLGAAASGAQPATDKLRAYQQHISTLAADSQVELARVTQKHGQETSRTAHALADEVTRVAAEATDRSKKQQEEAIKQFRDPFEQTGAPRGNGSGRTDASPPVPRASPGASMQSESRVDGAAFHAEIRGQAVPPAQQAGNKSSVKAT
jgi:phasin family protein